MIDTKNIPFELDMSYVLEDPQPLAITVVYEYPYGIRYQVTYNLRMVREPGDVERGRYLLEKVEHI